MASLGLVTSRRLLRLTRLAVSVRHQSVVRPSPDQRLGPDRVLPANSLTSTWPDGAVLIREHTDHESRAYPPKSVWTMLQDTLARVPDRTALGVKRDGVWVTWTYRQYVEEVQLVAKAFIKLGLKRSHAVGIIGFNAPEWHISNIAAVVAGGLGTGIYTTNSPDAVRYVAEHSRANLLVLENEDQLKKIESFKDDLKHLETVIMFRGEPEPGSDVISWQQLLEVGRGVEDSVLRERLEQQAVNQPALLVYTSGTTGNPKGVMISQDSLTWTCRAAQEVYDWRWDMEEGISYLPLSHVAAQVIDIYLAAYGGATIWFADDKALQGTLINTLKEVRPTRFLGVPRVWEKIEEKMREIAKQNSGIKRAVANWAKAAAFEHHAERMAGRPGNSFRYRIAQRLILSRIHAALGLDRAAHPETGGFYSSAAPLSPQTFQYFQSLDMPIMELLGSSETGGPMTAGLKGPGMRQGSVGKGYPHFETSILNPDKDGVGEIITRGRNVFMGYVWDEEKTKEVIDEEGWVHSGDLGRMDQDGFWYVAGRMKEVLITAGGENIAPVPIEENLKSELVEIASQIMVVGDKKKHLAVIITLKTVLDDKNQPTDILNEDVQEWLQTLGSKATTAKQLIAEDSEEVKNFIIDAIKRSNTRSVSNASKVHKFMIAPEDFSLAGGELTPTLKVKRHFVVEKYAKEIKAMYEYETMSSMW